MNIFLISALKHLLWFSLESSHRDDFNEYPQHMGFRRPKKILF